MKIKILVLSLGFILSACGGKGGSSSSAPAADIVGIWIDEPRAAALMKLEKDGNVDEACPAFYQKSEEDKKVVWLSNYMKIESSGKALNCNIHPLGGKDECADSGTVSGNSFTSKDGKASGSVTVTGSKATFVVNANGQQMKISQEKLSEEQFNKVSALLRECFNKTIKQPPAN
ncbi:MAG: hypothetical protein A4S09_05315 [Proteobacteria bacterium SG_bin7]|nr:MAG: hypothetical protein A4S09_05315 [Proteobacteria bacterium SG_bin7]